MPLYDLSGRDLISTQEWTVEEIKATLEFAKQLKRERYAGVFHKYLEGKTFLMLFYNTSTRTRVSFEAAATELGAHAQYLSLR